jgi:hypothetical protein
MGQLLAQPFDKPFYSFTCDFLSHSLPFSEKLTHSTLLVLNFIPHHFPDSSSVRHQYINPLTWRSSFVTK